jgi:cell wall-associated NlpC family hydrolase
MSGDKFLMDHETERCAVIAEALTWVGTPWHANARIKGAGVDCTMFVAEVYERAGVLPHLEFGDYSSDWFLHVDEEGMWKEALRWCEEVPIPQPGDFAAWKFGKAFSHAAIVINWPRIIHAYIPNRMVAEDDALGNCDLNNRPVRFASPWKREMPSTVGEMSEMNREKS